MKGSRCKLDDHGEVAYLHIKNKKKYNGQIVTRNINIRNVMPEYAGPDLYFDFDEDGLLVGIDIMFS